MTKLKKEAKLILKAEAVKLIKVYLSFDKRRYWDSLTPFISFFNITEEDLEGGK